MALLVVSPDLLFMYVFVVLGALVIVASLVVALRHSQPIKPWLFLLLGGLLLGGTGGFGPSFLGDYADFLKTVAQLDPESAEAKEAIASLAADLGAGNVPDEARALAESVLKQTDVPDAESVIDHAIGNAKPKGRESLTGVKRALARRAEGAAAAGAAATDAAPVRPPIKIEKLDPDALRALNTRSNAELQKLGVDPKTLRESASRVAPRDGG
jgi:hypothetical protein